MKEHHGHSWDISARRPQLVVIRHPAHSCLGRPPKTASRAAGFVKKSASSLPCPRWCLGGRITFPKDFFHSFTPPIHSFNKYILSLYLLPDTVFGAAGTLVKKMDKVLIFSELIFYEGRHTINTIRVVATIIMSKFIQEKKKEC